MDDAAGSLSSFHPLVREWFLSRYGRPTPVQEAAWPLIASGKHVLALAPTGSGKTLTAFLGAVSRIASGELPADSLSVLYVSPLKALGEDVRRNLDTPLAELGELFLSRGEAWPGIRAATRSGDTSQADRRRMLKYPPSILATTPESLALMLDSPASRSMLASVKLLVLDEIHALAGDKRGAMLACQAGRLALVAGEFQRVALSATARPAGAIADFVGGRSLSYAADGRAEYRRRPVVVVAPPSEKRIELRVEWPATPVLGAGDEARGNKVSGSAPRYAAVIPEIVRRMEGSTGLIVFTDSRRRAERMAFLVNESAGEGSAWAHHGSLSREARRVVEERFKAGELGCVVATASLELGIDVGSVDEVVLAGTPGSVASALQRIGRSGHGVGEVSKGSLFPFHGMDLVLAAAVARGVADRAVEETRPLSCPLDVLAQVLLELVLEGEFPGEGRRSADALYDIVLSFPPFERLPPSLFESTLQMLAGKYAGSRLRELEPRIFIDSASGTVAAGKGARELLYSSGGTIPDRGLYSMRVAGSKTRIGELDEEFVWERKVGEVFTLGAQAWRITEIDSEAVTVVPAAPDPDIVPFWKGEARFRSGETSSRALELLDELADLDAEDGASRLSSAYGFSPEAAEVCARFVAAQKAAGFAGAALSGVGSLSGASLPRTCSLPGTRRIAIEGHEEAGARADTCRLVLHTLRGLAINEPLALALSAALEESIGLPVRKMADDDLILLSLPRVEGLDPEDAVKRAFRSLAEAGRLEALIRGALEASGIFGAQFRENAGRALLLPRGMPGKRRPLWMTRLRAKKLFEAVRGREDFPVIVETWRSCLGDLFDLAGAKGLAERVADGGVELSFFSSRAPSPFAREALWKEVGDNMYRSDELEGRASSSVSDRVVAEALRSSRLRPRIDPSLVRDFEARLKRLVPGWAPEDALSFAEWVRERVLIPASELASIIGSSPALGAALSADPSCGGRVIRRTLPGASEEVLVHAERLEELEADPAARIAEWLRREAAVHPSRLTALFGLAGPELGEAIGDLVEDGRVVSDLIVEGSDDEAVIDAQNLEILLRRTRAAARPKVSARPALDLAKLVFALQGIRPATPAAQPASEDRPTVDIERALSALAGAAVPAELWETDILPARVMRYRSADLDALLSSSPWQWFGSGKGLVSLAAAVDLELFLPRRRPRSRSVLMPAGRGLRDFWDIRESSGLGSARTARELWAEAWKGLVASDSFRDLREGISNGFGADLIEARGPADPAAAGPVSPAFGSPRRIPRALRERWRGGAPVSGRWFALDLDEDESDADGSFGESDVLGGLGLDAARVRALASRYGLLCRGILEREIPALRWGELFPAMRRLELAGELLSGRFFEGLEGPQFLDPAALAAFLALDEARERGPAWINALDPAASSLYAVAERRSVLPQRVGANRICVEGAEVLALSTRSFRELKMLIQPGDPRIASVMSLYPKARERDARPETRIAVDTVNGRPASESPYADALKECGFEADRKRMMLW